MRHRREVLHSFPVILDLAYFLGWNYNINFSTCVCQHWNLCTSPQNPFHSSALTILCYSFYSKWAILHPAQNSSFSIQQERGICPSPAGDTGLLVDYLWRVNVLILKPFPMLPPTGRLPVHVPRAHNPPSNTVSKSRIDSFCGHIPYILLGQN